MTLWKHLRRVGFNWICRLLSYVNVSSKSVEFGNEPNAQTLHRSKGQKKNDPTEQLMTRLTYLLC